MKRRTGMILAVLAILASLCLCTGCSAAGRNAAADIRSGIAYVEEGFEVLDGEGIWYAYASGTGFFVGENGKAPNYLVTNYHVIEWYVENGRGDLMEAELYEDMIVPVKAKIRVYLNDSDYAEAYLRDGDPQKDIAILQLEKPVEERTPMKLRVPDDSLIGRQVTVAGYPGIADNIYADSTNSRGAEAASIATGTVSRLFTQSGTGIAYIQTDAPIMHGNSGGPMADETGSVIGINTWKVSEDGEEVRYAVNISEVIAMLDRNGIPYVLAGRPGPVTWILAAAAAAVVIAVVIAVIARIRKGRREPVPSPIPAPPPVPPRNPNDSGFRLQCVAGALENRRFMIPREGQLVLGRNPDMCSVLLPEGTSGVSGRHCAVWIDSGGIFLQDLGSTHGTFLEPGSRLSANQPLKISEGAVFWLGSKNESFVVGRKRVT